MAPVLLSLRSKVIDANGQNLNLGSEPQREAEMQQPAWLSWLGVAAGAVCDSQTRRHHAARTVRCLRGQVGGGVEIMTPPGENDSMSAPIRFRISPANADQAKPLLRFGGWALVAGNRAV